ncbi:DUF483 domain-containing protein [Candidatus Woesearchaeota archaeon]|nr:DUF483 domain-containing protein [Candidatus Woesearchaeota archaeon]
MINRLVDIFGNKTKALEVLYLLEGVKPVVRHGFYEHELPKIESFCEANNLVIEKSLYKVVIVDAEEGEYSNKGIKVKTDDPRQGMLFIYISKDKAKAELASRYESEGNHKELGLLLGYPLCCIDFFIKHKNEQSMANNDYVEPILSNSEGDMFQFYTNVFKKQFDVTLLNHFPCSLDCEGSIDLAQTHLDIIRKYDPPLAEYLIQRLKCKVNMEKGVIEFY